MLEKFRANVLKNKFACKTNFLQFYEVASAIPKHLVTKAKKQYHQNVNMGSRHRQKYKRFK